MYSLILLYIYNYKTVFYNIVLVVIFYVMNGKHDFVLRIVVQLWNL